jgi:sugar/nucleoside kinase (ribokinase family)
MKFLVVGNLTKDIIRTSQDERIVFGGAASYCSITAVKLGCDTHVLSKGNDELNGWIKTLRNSGINVDLQRSERTTYFINDYLEGKRKQFVLSDAGEIDFKTLGRMDVIHLGPVFNEITLDCLKKARKKCRILSLDTQGFARNLNGKEVVKSFWEEREDFLKYVDLLKVGREEMGCVSRERDYEKVCEELKSFGVEVVELTLGEEGSIVAEEEIHRIPAYRTTLIDKTGSGDVYSTAFAVRYFETKNALESGLFASAAASFVVEDFGAKNIKDRKKVLERFRKMRTEDENIDGNFRC